MITVIGTIASGILGAIAFILVVQPTLITNHLYHWIFRIPHIEGK